MRTCESAPSPTRTTLGHVYVCPLTPRNSGPRPSREQDHAETTAKTVQFRKLLQDRKMGTPGHSCRQLSKDGVHRNLEISTHAHTLHFLICRPLILHCPEGSPSWRRLQGPLCPSVSIKLCPSSIPKLMLPVGGGPQASSQDMQQGEVGNTPPPGYR